MEAVLLTSSYFARIGRSLLIVHFTFVLHKIAFHIYFIPFQCFIYTFTFLHCTVPKSMRRLHLSVALQNMIIQDSLHRMWLVCWFTLGKLCERDCALSSGSTSESHHFKIHCSLPWRSLIVAKEAVYSWLGHWNMARGAKNLVAFRKHLYWLRRHS